MLEENWEFDYVLVKDRKGEVILATFLTTSITKDDMLLPADVSAEIEIKRKTNPYFYTSKSLQIGSQLSEGEHLFLNKKSRNWKEAMKMFLNKVSDIQEKNGAESVMLRDMSMDDSGMDDFMVNNGFFKTEMPKNNIIRGSEWRNEDEFLATLSSKSRYNLRKNVLKYEEQFEVKYINEYSESDLKKYYKLYLNVKNNGLDLNTFKLPFSVFQNYMKSNDWDLIALYPKLKTQNDPVSIGFCHKGKSIYTFLIMGLNYEHSQMFNTYRQTIYQSLKRAKQLGYKNINMGYLSDFEKKKFGATQIRSCAYMQVKDNYNMEALSALSISKSMRKTRI